MLRFSSLALTVAIFSLTKSLPDGAPRTACDTLTPNHRSNTPQTSEVPYVIDFSVFDFENDSYVYNPGRTYTCKTPINVTTADKRGSNTSRSVRVFTATHIGFNFNFLFVFACCTHNVNGFCCAQRVWVSQLRFSFLCVHVYCACACSLLVCVECPHVLVVEITSVPCVYNEYSHSYSCWSRSHNVSRLLHTVSFGVRPDDYRGKIFTG